MRFIGHSFQIVLALLISLLALPGRAETAPFDLAGPRIEVRVQRGGQTLPIAEVPDLQAKDRLWVHPDLPDSQSVRYLMVVVFLRGATNPPPESWFTVAETWNKKVHEEGIFVSVPDEAEEALVLLAPDTGGAFSTLRAAVRGKPGAFVRAAQDLEQASLDRSRLEKYLEAVRETSITDPEQLKARTTLLARSLNIRLDQQCFDKPTAQQVPCLTQNTDQLVLDDAHSQNMVAALTTGAPTDLLAQISSTPTARSGYYSPYIGAVVDVVRILGTAHSPQFQYIPALALPKKEQLNLRLNNPPSFRNPKSVLVIGLPQVRPAQQPPLRAIDPAQIFCATRPSLVIPAEGAPLVFSSQLAHNFVLHVETRSGALELPATPDPARGGFVIDTAAIGSAALDGEVTAALRGVWGFRSFEGPHFRLRAAHPTQWVVASKDASALIVGREDLLHLQSANTSCVSEVALKDEQGKGIPVDWKAAKPDELEIKVPLQHGSPGSVKILVRQFGLPEADEVQLHTYAEAGRVDSFTIHAGDFYGVLQGTRLDQVRDVEANGVSFTPKELLRAGPGDNLKAVTANSLVEEKLKPAQLISVRILLKDGRVLTLNTAVQPARPKLAVLSRSVQENENSGPPVVRLSNPEELPQDATLNFFLKTQAPESFPPSERIEVATADETFHVLLSIKDGNLTMQDATTVFVALDPMKLLGPSAFGPLKFRAVSADGVEGDWQPLINLVRIPALKGVYCEGKTDKQCTLSGDKLFLIDAVSPDPDFSNSVPVPDGFVEETLKIPELKGNTLYIKLRDDPARVNTAVLPALNNQP